MAENVAQYLHKGDQVTVNGDLSMRTYMIIRTICPLVFLVVLQTVE